MPRPHLFRDLHLHVHPGERLAVVGRNGAGKTTLAKLLTGLLHPHRRRRHCRHTGTGTTGIAATSAAAAAVFQDFIRYPLSLRDNVRLGDPPSTAPTPTCCPPLESADALDLAWTSCLDGLDTPALARLHRGPRSVRRPVAEVALARAMYALHPHGRQVLIVDEPTAHLGRPSRAPEIFERLLRRTRGRTLSSSHTASPPYAERTASSSSTGAIAEEGDHAELLAANGHYAHWYHLQANLITQDDR